MGWMFAAVPDSELHVLRRIWKVEEREVTIGRACTSMRTRGSWNWQWSIWLKFLFVLWGFGLRLMIHPFCKKCSWNWEVCHEMVRHISHSTAWGFKILTESLDAVPACNVAKHDDDSEAISLGQSIVQPNVTDVCIYACLLPVLWNARNLLCFMFVLPGSDEYLKSNNMTCRGPSSSAYVRTSLL